MRSYPDASLVVSAFTEEVASAIADRWIASLEPGDLVSSAWCLTEISGALAGKVRARSLTPSDRARVASAIPRLIVEVGMIVTVEQHHFTSASSLLERSPSPLKAGDALHLAIAADVGAKLWTLDRRMADAGTALGLNVELLR